MFILKSYEMVVKDVIIIVRITIGIIIHDVIYIIIN